MCDNNSGRPLLPVVTMAGGSGSGEEVVDDEVNNILAQKNQIIREQRDQIIRLKRELDGLASERDLLLCENSNLRFELEMVELKRLQDIESFPPKMERPQISPAPLGGGSVHLQEQTYIQAPTYMQTQTYPTPSPPPPSSSSSSNAIYSRSSPNGSGSYVSVAQPLHKKGSLRNGDVLKRSRVQTTYELSQDILDKQIEVLERKYGGVKARNAALTIQRAFRRYTLIKKFAAITAMAKAEKRISRRMQNNGGGDDARSTLGENDQCCEIDYIRTFDNGHECGTMRALPMRSMSLRERRNVDNISIPRSQSGTPTNPPCWENYSSAPHLQLPHNSYYSSTEDFKQDSHHLQQQPQQPPSGNLSTCSTPQNYNANNCYSGGPRSRSSLSNNSNNASSRKVPPEVPKRTSSISNRSVEPGRQHHRSNGLSKSTENGSLSSVQSSGSDSSISADRIQCTDYPGSPIWKRKGSHHHLHQEYSESALETSLGNISNSSTSSGTIQYNLDHHHHLLHSHHHRSEQAQPNNYKISETVRKRQYRVGLNLFNKKPDRGISYLIRKGFLENTPTGVARFLITRKGLSKQMIGEYLGNLQSAFCMAVLECFALELDLSGMQVDVALRKFQQHFRMPGEAQKIERLMEVFSSRYCQCNVDIVTRLRSPDTIFVLAFAIIMLNTDLHTPSIKPERRMRVEDFIKNLRGIDDCGDIDSDMLVGIYERVKANEFKPGSDHVTQVMKVQATIVGKKPNMALPHRRLVCYCRLYEIPDTNKKERPGVHQREVFLFNDLLVITKILSKKKSSVTYTFRNSYPLCGMVVTTFEKPHYPFGIRLSQRVDGKILVTFNARNEHDRCKFAEDLKESISEMDEMENLRIEAELERQKSSRGNRSGTENRDSGVADVEVCSCQCPFGGQTPIAGGPNEGNSEEIVHETQIKRSALSNSLLDIHEQFTGEKVQRRGSVGSLDSGMSVSFQSTSASTCSRSDKITNKGKVAAAAAAAANNAYYQHHSFLSGLFNKKQQPNIAAAGAATASNGSATGGNAIAKSTEV